MRYPPDPDVRRLSPLRLASICRAPIRSRWSRRLSSGADGLPKPKRNAPHIAGRLGYREERYVFFVCGRRPALSGPAGRREPRRSGQRASAAPMPTRKIAASHSPVTRPMRPAGDERGERERVVEAGVRGDRDGALPAPRAEGRGRAARRRARPRATVAAGPKPSRNGADHDRRRGEHLERSVDGEWNLLDLIVHPQATNVCAI